MSEVPGFILGLSKFQELKKLTDLKIAYNEILIICSDLNKLEEHYDNKIRNSGIIKGMYYQHRRNKDKRIYSKTLKKIKENIENNRDQKDNYLRFLKVAKKTAPEKVPKELSHLV